MVKHTNSEEAFALQFIQFRTGSSTGAGERDPMTIFAADLGRKKWYIEGDRGVLMARPRYAVSATGAVKLHEY